MKKNENKILDNPKRDSNLNRDLKILVEEFLEKDIKKVLRSLGDKPEKTEEFCLKIGKILSKKTLWIYQPDEEDLQGMDFKSVITDWHILLKPIWEQIKEAIFNYIYNIVPARKEKHDFTSLYSSHPDISEFRALEEISYKSWEDEQYYPVDLPISALTVTMSFESGSISIAKRNYNVVYDLIEILSNAPISLFHKCEYCGKCIILLRNDKKYCPGCAAKAYQKEKWGKYPDKCKEYEKMRYQNRKANLLEKDD